MRQSSLPRRLFLQSAAAAATVHSWATGVEARSEQGVFIEETQSAVVVGNGELEIALRKDTGGIEQIHSRTHGADLRNANTDAAATIWELGFVESNARTTARMAPEPTITTRTGSDTATVTLAWSEPRVEPLDRARFEGDIVVQVSVTAGDQMARWTLSVDNRSDFTIRRAACPVISAIAPRATDGSDAVIYPAGMGRRIENPIAVDTLPGEIYPMEMANMQFTAYTGDGPSFYLQAEDPDGHQKSIEWAHEPGGHLRLQHGHLPTQHSGANLDSSYQVATGWFAGNWYDAADRYREWVKTEGWLANESPGNPDWLQDLGLTHKLRTYPEPDVHDDVSYDEAVQLARDWKEQLQVANVQVFWQDWREKGAETVRPAEGMGRFRAALDDFASNDMVVGCFESGKFLNSGSEFANSNEDEVLDWVLRRRDGQPRRKPVGWASDPLYVVDFTVDGWQRTLRAWSSTIAALGVREITLDGFPSFYPPCFSDRHDHPPGRGKWFSRRARDALRRFRQRLREEQSGAAVGGEGITDFYLPYMDIHRTKDAVAESYYRPQRFYHDTGDIIPLFSYAFGDYITTRARGLEGRFPLTSDRGDFERIALGRVVEWGVLPELFTPAAKPDSDDDGTFIGRIARARETYANRFVARGEMLRKPAYDTDTVSLVDELVTREGRREFEFTEPAIKGSAWTSSRDEIGILFADIAPGTGPHTAHVPLSEQQFELPPEPWVAYVVTNGRYELVARSNDSLARIELELSERDVALLGFASSTEQRMRALEAIVAAEEAVEESDPEASELLQNAKRAFEADNTTDAIEMAEAALASVDAQTGTGSATPSTQGSAGSTPTPSMTTGSSGTNTTGPGLGVVTGLLGAAGGILALIRRSDGETESRDSG